MECTSTRKSCFLEDDNGLASIANYPFTTPLEKPFLSRPLCSPRKTNPNNYTSFSHLSSPRSLRSFNEEYEYQQPPYFLDACFLCKKSLGGNKDIFMYRGDTAFCSEECRSEQIDKDEAKENWSVSFSVRSLSKKEKSEKTTNTSPNKTSNNFPIQSGAVAAA